MKPLISLIVPVYNVAPYVGDMIESALIQSYRNIEVLLIDDGSTDDSLEICQSAARGDMRLKVLHQKNHGVSSARNLGLDFATGDYICFADSDDVLSPDYIEYLYKLISDNDADVALTKCMFGNFDKKQTARITESVCTGRQALLDILTYKIPIGVYCKLFKRDLLEQNRLKFNESLFMGEGFNFNSNAFNNAHKVTVGNRKIYYYRRDNPTSACTAFSEEKWRNGIYAISCIENAVFDGEEDLINALTYARWRTHVDAFALLKIAHAENICPELYKDCIREIKEEARQALAAPISKRNFLIGVATSIFPEINPMLVQLRRKICGVKLNATIKRGA